MMRFLSRNRAGQKAQTPEWVTVVSGLPRSGTSMLMKVLEAGGMPVLTDRIRTADEDNPKGYYEFERVKRMPDGDNQWLEGARGQAVKVISALLEFLPAETRYKVVFMRRNMHEILASQRQMLIRRGEPTDAVSDEALAAQFRKHLSKIEAWLAKQPNVEVLYLEYNAILADPRPHLERLNAFLDGRLDLERMLQVVDPSLYRQKS
ncbi:MAG TPA: sulfotransferase [Anaerolineaceae bacterium]|nr:sulfotransferase [Anaerolineaceae bacterium]